MDTISDLRVAAYKIPTATPESDGTAEWDSTTLVTVHVDARGVTGFGYTYADLATATLTDDRLKDIIIGRDPFAIDAAWAAMIRSVRNLGRRGIAAMAISAVDNALWDLKAKLLNVPLVTLLGNHEDWMLKTMRDSTRHSWILGMEAFETIASYSVEAAVRLRQELERAGARLVTERVDIGYEVFFDVVPPEHLEF